MAWRVARSLYTLRDQIDAKFPGRNRASDGYIGDANHDATSDHSPWYGPGIVTAADWTHDPRVGFDIDRFTDELAASRDNRIKYIIANGLILDSRPQFSPWQWVRYGGPNPHTSHVHLSVVASAACDDTRPWNIPMLGGGAPTPPPSRPPTIPPWPLPGDHYFGLVTGPEQSHGGYYPHERPWVTKIQQALQRKGFAPSDPGWADGVYEQPTADAVAAWQRAAMPGTTRYGEVWSDDWAVLLRP